MKFAPSMLRLIERLRGSFAWIEAPELKRRLDHGEAVTVVDVKGPDEFTGPLGHIATARNIPVAELVGRLTELAGLEGDRLCSSAGPTSAPRLLRVVCMSPDLHE